MRLNATEIKHIKKSVHDFDPLAQIYLFGSRVDDTKKGGDIDLLIFSELLSDKDARIIRRRICDQLGEQKIDIIIAKDTSDPFVRIALSTGILL